MEFLNQNRNLVIGVVVVVLIGAVFVIIKSISATEPSAQAQQKKLPPQAIAEMQRQSAGHRP